MKRQKGSVIVYILIAIFLTGLLIASLTQGAKKSATTQQIDELMMFLMTDIRALQAGITECAQVHSEAAAGVVNPNTPFPLYSDLSSGAAGEVITDIKCPGAPTAQQTIFNANSFKILSDTATYTTTYFTDATEGVYFRIVRTSADALWTEAISRLNDKYSTCAAAVVTDNPDPIGANCSNGCFYYWVLRRATSDSDFEADCP